MSELPEDPFVNEDMLPMAKSAHDLFVAFMAAGFTEHQALQIITGVVTTLLMGVRGSPDPELCDRIGLPAPVRPGMALQVAGQTAQGLASFPTGKFPRNRLTSGR